MNIFRFSSLTISLSFAMSFSAQAADLGENQIVLSQPYFLNQVLDLAKALPAPPLRGSKIDLQDFKTIKEIEAKRTQFECDRASQAVAITLGNFFGPDAGGPLKEPEVVAWRDFFESIKVHTASYVDPIKAFWKRPRPYIADEALKPCVKKDPTNAYPSGHTAISRVFAHVLSLKDPSRKAAFFKRADEIANDRLIAGAHHPSDLVAGKQAADQIFALLKKNKQFLADVKNLK